MSADEGQVYLPIKQAFEFLREKGLTEIETDMNAVLDRFSGNQARRIRKGIFVTELEQLGLFGEFCDRFWKNSTSETGIKVIRQYKRALNALDEEINSEDEHIDAETVSDGSFSIDESSFAYESDLRDYLVNNLHLIEPGLTLYHDERGVEGVEYAVDNRNKRVDILAIDQNQTPVVIELKVSKGYERVLGQCQYYKNRLKQRMTVDTIRVIIIAREITDHLKTACMDLPDIELFEYSLSIGLNRISSGE